jgi:hypothetical protein
MPDEILSREAIAKQADAAAMRSVASSKCEPNPYAAGTVAAREWAVAFERYLLLHSNPEGEGGA